MEDMNITKELDICSEYKKDNDIYIKDYRLKKDIKLIKGKLSDLNEWYYKSEGLGDLLGVCRSFVNDIDNIVIVKYSNKYAIGVKNN